MKAAEKTSRRITNYFTDEGHDRLHYAIETGGWPGNRPTMSKVLDDLIMNHLPPRPRPSTMDGRKSKSQVA